MDNHWKSLTNTLSGLFCASLNFIDKTITTEPRLSFKTTNDDINQEDEQLRYGSLPHENVCTENLTPWIKLLPCKAKVRKKTWNYVQLKTIDSFSVVWHFCVTKSS